MVSRFSSRRLLAAAALLVAAASCGTGQGHGPGPGPGQGGTTTTAAPPSGPPTCEDRTLGGRTVVVCTVADVPEQGLVVALHGRGSTATEMRAVTQLEQHAAEEGLAVAYPNGMDGGWGDDTFTTSSRPGGDEDVRFLDELIDTLRSEPDIDDGPVGVVGFSNGASMALRYAIERPDDVRAVVSIAGQLPRDPAVRPRPDAEPVPLLGFYGTADPLRSYENGIPEPPNRQPGQSTPTLSTPDTIAAFVGSLPADSEPTESDTVPDDGTRLRTERWADNDGDGDDGRAVVVWHTIVDGGHTWPQAHAPLPASFGTVSQEIDASAEAIAFIVEPRG